jgi:CxxC motif-containing protein (DUF1111 family)
MCASARVWCCALGLVWVSLFAVGGSVALGGRGNPERGRELFVKEWKAGESAATGDGLGPMFNESSCVACHSLGGIGGAGPAHHNVDLLTAAPLKTSDKRVAAWRQRLREFHPGLSDTTNAVLHKFSSDANYSAFRDRILDLIYNRHSSGPIAELDSANGDRYFISQRNTTPLFGAGIIDSITDAEILETLAQQKRDNPEVVGRFLGRFGWRGQMADLQSFVLGACATELGLSVPGRAQATNPLQSNSPAGKLDMTAEQCDDLFEFIASLPAPRQLRGAGVNQTALIRAGENTFASIGCTVCHRPTLGRAQGIYSDLLMHDVGSRLEDPASASESVSTQYFGRSAGLNSPLASQRRREWKTPPLWGLRDSGPYLHDGRAATIDEAIVYHGGQAASAAVRYGALAPSEKSHLLLFLSTLAGPDPALLARHAVNER